MFKPVDQRNSHILFQIVEAILFVCMYTVLNACVLLTVKTNSIFIFTILQSIRYIDLFLRQVK